ncbi:unnamed protein product [Acidocella sp. C78]|uniref:tetratricopeptide repeat protein n=1 Tax=Acidocella sp. C78 TaxID=1671486 RepID=UPI00191BC0FA|nr:tetratricopeptide repeat protein [Acidocella sp. C78]CAG4904296.1 unnamed protein product [Acidocella sp. C78]
MNAATPRTTNTTVGELIAEITALEREGRLHDAEALAARAAAALPRHPHMLHLAGMLAHRRGDIPRAIELIEASLALAPDVALYPRNASYIYRRAGRLDDALATALRAAALAPDNRDAHHNLALIHLERHELDAGIEAVDRAIALAPDFAEAHFARAELLLLGGRLAEGWESYEWRFKLKQAEGMLPKTDKPQWDGSPLPEGRLLLVADQGFGDCIQFGRYIPWAAARAPNPVLACESSLKPLLRQLPEIGRFADSWAAAGEYDAYIPLSGLPRLAGTTIATIPAQIPYLRADPRMVEAWRRRLATLVPPGLKRVGLVWAGRPAHLNDHKRTVRLGRFAPLFARPDIAIVTVQKGDRIDEVGNYFGRAPLVNLGPSIFDFTDTLAILHCLDRLVTIDTSVAHLAGAAGVATSVILPYTPDWRWLLDREDTPWYPSLRLFRQERAADWSGVIERVAGSI